MKRVALAGLGLAGLVLLLVWVLRAPLTLRLMERMVARNFASDLMRELPDGLHVALCGAGSPLPDPKRSGPCVAVIAGGQLIVVDAGAGSSRVLTRLRIPQGEIGAVLLTHYHSDHIDGLGELELQRWANAGARSPVPVHGPGPKLHAVVDGINQAYGPSRAARVAHHGEDVVPSSGAGAVALPFAVPAPGEGVVVIDRDGLVVTAFLVDHAPVEPAVGYRFDYAGRSALLSGDTKRSDNLVHFARGVDLLVHEALAPQLVAVLTRGAREAGRERVARITEDILDYHTTPVEAAELARAAGARRLLFHHIVPPLLIPPMETIFVEGVAEAYDGPFGVGRDGTLVSLPAGSDAIRVEELL